MAVVILVATFGSGGYVLGRYEPPSYGVGALLVVVGLITMVVLIGLSGTPGPSTPSPGPLAERFGDMILGSALDGLERLYGPVFIGVLFALGAVGFAVGHHYRTQATGG